MLPLHLETGNFCTELNFCLSYDHQGRVLSQGGSPATHGWSPTNLRMVTQIMNCITDIKFGTYTLLTKLTPGDNFHGWSPTIYRMVPHHPKDGHPPTKGLSPTRRKRTKDREFDT